MLMIHLANSALGEAVLSWGLTQLRILGSDPLIESAIFYFSRIGRS